MSMRSIGSADTENSGDHMAVAGPRRHRHSHQGAGGRTVSHEQEHLHRGPDGLHLEHDRDHMHPPADLEDATPPFKARPRRKIPGKTAVKAAAAAAGGHDAAQIAQWYRASGDEVLVALSATNEEVTTVSDEDRLLALAGGGDPLETDTIAGEVHRYSQ